MMKCFDKMVYKKPVLESYSAFGFFVEGASGENGTLVPCTAADGDLTEDDGLDLSPAENN